jgi:hypothetical protein
MESVAGQAAQASSNLGVDLGWRTRPPISGLDTFLTCWTIHYTPIQSAATLHAQNAPLSVQKHTTPLIGLRAMDQHSYGVILDAGSSGTRVYVYNWKTAANARASASAAELQRLPEIKTKKKWRKKVHPGVSTFGEKPEEVGPEHLADLVEFALDIVPPEEVENTPIFLLATAGMRLLPEHQRAQVLENICGYFQRETKFQLPDCDLHVQVISGGSIRLDRGELLAGRIRRAGRARAWEWTSHLWLLGHGRRVCADRVRAQCDGGGEARGRFEALAVTEG